MYCSLSCKNSLDYTKLFMITFKAFFLYLHPRGVQESVRGAIHRTTYIYIHIAMSQNITIYIGQSIPSTFFQRCQHITVLLNRDLTEI